MLRLFYDKNRSQDSDVVTLVLPQHQLPHARSERIIGFPLPSPGTGTKPRRVTGLNTAQETRTPLSTDNG